MEFKFSCPNCGQRIAATLDQIGARGMCPTCSSPFDVPAPDGQSGARKTPPPPPPLAQTHSAPSSGAPPPPPPAKKAAGNYNWIAAVMAMVMILGFRGCFSGGSDANRITKVLNRCAEISRQAARYNNDPGMQASFFASEAQKIDVSRCPPDFRMAFQAHIFAWQQAAPAFANNNFATNFLEGFMAGTSGDSRFLGGANRGAGMATQNINSTYFELTQIAARYGAKIPTSIAGE